MPTIRDIPDQGPYTFYFVSKDGEEPPHIHVRRNSCSAKFWLRPVKLQKSRKFPAHELRRIKKIIEENRHMILEAWDEHFY